MTSRRATLTAVSLPLALALLDAAGGLYLLHYALRHQRHGKDALLVTAVFLLACAVALGWHARPVEEPGQPAADRAGGRPG